MAQCEGEFRGVQGGAGREAEHPGRRVHQIVGVGALDPGGAAAGFGDRAGQLRGRQGGGGAQQELVDRAVGQRMGLKGQDVDPVAGQHDAERCQAAGGVPDRRTHPPQHRLGGCGVRRRGAGRDGRPHARGIRAGRRVGVRGWGVAVTPCPPGVERGGGGQRHGRGDEQIRSVRLVSDQVRDRVGDGDGGEQGGEFDEVPPPVVGAAGTLRGGHISHDTTVTEWCCLIANTL